MRMVVRSRLTLPVLLALATIAPGAAMLPAPAEARRAPRYRNANHHRQVLVARRHAQRNARRAAFHARTGGGYRRPVRYRTYRPVRSYRVRPAPRYHRRRR